MVRTGTEADVVDHDQLVVALVVGKGGRVEGPRGQQLGVGLSDAPRHLTQVLGVELDTERGEQVGGGPLGGGPRRPVPCGRRGARGGAGVAAALGAAGRDRRGPQGLLELRQNHLAELVARSVRGPTSRCGA